jgi:hypothetical protein
MKGRQRSLHFLPDSNSAIRYFSRGVSLHGHTQHSKESLGFLNRHVDTLPIVSQVARHALARYRQDHGEDLDFGRAYWTAPLCARNAHELERKQIEDALGLEGLVSLTDHDNIDGAMELRNEDSEAIISLEWTVPYGRAYFHLGVHNLPPAQACDIASRLLTYTGSPDETQLPGLLDELDSIPHVLLVLNHPLWEMEPIGKAALADMLDSFIRSYGTYLHALEVSGLRPWRENRRVLEMAEDLSLPVVSGGDRHGCEASTMLNLTRARNFSEFVAEIRRDGPSEIAVMPSYQQPFGLRMMQVAWDVLREYPSHPCGRVHWADRVFFEWYDGTIRPLSRCFKAGVPNELRFLTGAMGMLERQPCRSLVHAAWSLQSGEDALPRNRQSWQPLARPAFSSGGGDIA